MSTPNVLAQAIERTNKRLSPLPLDRLSPVEKREYAALSCDPIRAIQLRMIQRDLKPRDLLPMIGARGRVSEVLSGKRPLSIGMIRALHAHLGIPLEHLVAQ